MNNTFGKDIILPNEPDRLKALQRHELLNGLPQGYFNNMATIMARTFDTPIALVSLVMEEQVSFAGNEGMEGTDMTPRGVSLCSLAVLDDSPTIFPDTMKEPCLIANPLVHGEFGLRFYAGAPIIDEDGAALGTVCVVDKVPRQFSEKEQEMLRGFARTAMQEIRQRAQTLQLPKVKGV